MDLEQIALDLNLCSKCRVTLELLVAEYQRLTGDVLVEQLREAIADIRKVQTGDLMEQLLREHWERMIARRANRKMPPSGLWECANCGAQPRQLSLFEEYPPKRPPSADPSDCFPACKKRGWLP